MKKINALIKRYGIAISKVENSTLETFKKLNESIILSQLYLNELREFIRANSFNSQEEEINFFKYKKPKIYGNLKFFARQLNFYTECPNSNISNQRVYIKKALKELESKKRKHLAFYKYYNNDNKGFDNKYFVRGDNQLDLFSNTFHLNKDPYFSTSHDFIAAEIVAYNLSTKFFNEMLESLKLRKAEKSIKEVLPEILSDLKWKGTKTDLVELMYALNASGAIGNIGVKKMKEICEILFNEDFGNFYKTFAEIKAREKDSTKFLDRLKSSLTHKMRNEP